MSYVSINIIIMPSVPIIHMQLFAVGSSQGKVGVFTVEQGRDVVCPVSVFEAHHPQPGKQDQRFGQLGHQ